MKFTVFTDGSSRGNPGPGGWAAVIIVPKGEKGRVTESVLELGGNEAKTTNNRMEIRAAIEALELIPEESEINLYTDSSYLINGITKWVKGWKNIDWMTRAKEPVLNRDLWEGLDALVEERTIDWKYVGGHAGVAGNERCDEIATCFADNKHAALYKGTLKDYPIKNILDIGAASEKLQTKSRRDAKAFSYISMVNGVIEKHQLWKDCEKRVKGVKGARYKKSLNIEDEEKIIAEFSSI